MAFGHRSAFQRGEEMLINGKCTVFSKGGETHLFERVYWLDSRGKKVAKNGVSIEDAVVCYLYDIDGYVPMCGDIVVRGKADFVFDRSTGQKESESMKRFRMLFPDFAVVKSVGDYRFGSLPHIELAAR